MAERRFVTVLFVDLVGFTPFAEDRDAEQVRDTLDRYFGIARLAVERHGGTIEKFIGDAVMAVWGTPTAHEDDAERAVRAAMDLLDSVQGLGSGISARAGIVTGEAAVTIGATSQGMVAGDLVNTASRLQSVAPPGTILVSAGTMNAAQAAIVFEPAGPQELKGKSAPVEVYRAVRVVANRGGQLRSEALEAPFVGREEELRLLKDQLHATTRDGRARLVSISGPAGIGKSRLTWEFEKYIDGVVETIFWHRGRSPAYGEGVTFWALGEMVRRRADLAETDDEATTREHIKAAVAQWASDPDEQLWIEGALLTLLGLEPAPAGGRDVLFAAWRTFFERVSAQATTALVFEDIQWADTGMLDFIDHLLEWSKNHPLLIVTLARPELYERRPDWGSGHRLMTAIPLEPLTEDRMRQLLEGLVPGLPEQAVAAVLSRADGVPLYAVETVRMLVAEGRVESVAGTYRPTGDLHDLAVPETLRSLVASRLDALDPQDRSLLQDASVIGQRFTTAALAAVSGMGVDDIDSRLRVLLKRELLDLEADPRSPERGQYGFVQSVIREVAYGTLARRERRNRHLAAARYYEALGDEELAGVLATHYLAAHEASEEGAEADAVAAQARLALRGAAERAAALGAHDQAVAYLEQALSVGGEGPDRASLMEMAATSANAMSRQDVAEQWARQAISIYTESGDAAAVARTSALLGRVLIDSGHLQQAIESMESAIAGTEGVDDSSARILATLSRAYMRSYQPQLSIEAADRALGYAERHNREDVVAEALVNKGSSLGMIGRRREAAALHQTAVSVAAAGGWVELELRARNNLSVGLIGDDPRAALDIVRAGGEMARKFGQRMIMNWHLGTACMYVLGIGDDPDPILLMLEEAITDTPPTFDKGRGTAIRAFYRAIRGEPLGDLDSDQVADPVSRADPQIKGMILGARAEEALLAGRLDEAYTLATEASSSWHNLRQMFLPTAGRAAMWAGDVARMRTVAAGLEQDVDGSAWEEQLRKWAAAAVAALEGRSEEAARGLREAVQGMRAVGFGFFGAQMAMDAIGLFPDRREFRDWETDARATFERMKAKPYLSRLDELSGAAGTSRSPERQRAGEGATSTV